jgi:16S rRNA C967 or C1407 C5-methylase (RsmB/RsmF family)/NOL1/NOP2/fmu family ribosome biogenesis protein
MGFPKAFEDRVRLDLFLGEPLLKALDETPPVSVRINPSKDIEIFNNSEKVDWCENAFYLQERPSFIADPLFHAGCYYPQEAGSMVINKILKGIHLPEDPVILDLCAAPGGKSTLIASFLNNKGLLVSNEVIQSRAKILRENLVKWGYANTIVTNNDPDDFNRLKYFFDVLVVDAPCSGEGMFRKDPNSRNEWSDENVHLCSLRQKRILGDAWDALKPGGYLIYSTCTFNSSENEENVRFIIDLGAELIDPKLDSSITKGREDLGHYFIPGKTKAEGFYIAVLHKNEGSGGRLKFELKKEFKQLKEIGSLKDLAQTEQLSFWQWNEKILGIPEKMKEQMMHVVAKMHVVKAGVMIGEIQRKGITPSEELALAPGVLSWEPRIELSKEQALQYLHGDTFTLESKPGLYLVTFQNQPLGWIKHLGNRFNNLYPKEWRIRMNLDKLV